MVGDEVVFLEPLLSAPLVIGQLYTFLSEKVGIGSSEYMNFSTMKTLRYVYDSVNNKHLQKLPK